VHRILVGLGLVEGREEKKNPAVLAWAGLRRPVPINLDHDVMDNGRLGRGAT
jgi:hypothetical protein